VVCHWLLRRSKIQVDKMTQDIKVIVGARTTTQPGYISTDLRSNEAPLDMRRAEDWAKYFREGSISQVLAEHCIEHLWPEEAEASLRNVYRYLKRGGKIRIAVPDKNNPDPAYQAHSAPGGSGRWIARLFYDEPNEPSHLVHWDFQSLSALLSHVGFRPVLLEFFDAAGVFWRRPWSKEDGDILRSYGSEYNRTVYLPWWGFENLSIVIDGYKD
jgi:predicted SAM-dependent methyltransferase